MGLDLDLCLCLTLLAAVVTAVRRVSTARRPRRPRRPDRRRIIVGSAPRDLRGGRHRSVQGPHRPSEDTSASVQEVRRAHLIRVVPRRPDEVLAV